MNEYLQIVIQHHLYLFVPMLVGVWVWSNWGSWQERIALARLRRALSRAQMERAAQRATRGDPPTGASGLRGRLSDLESAKQLVADRIWALECQPSSTRASTVHHGAAHGPRRRKRSR